MTVTIDVPADLTDLGGRNPLARRLIDLAYIHTSGTDNAERSQTAGEAIRTMPGTPGHRLVAWEDLVAQVEQWRDAQTESDALTPVEWTQDMVVRATVWAISRTSCRGCLAAGYVLTHDHEAI